MAAAAAQSLLEKGLMAFGAEEGVGDMQDRPGKDEGPTQGVAPPIDRHQRPGQFPGLGAVIPVGAARGSAARPDGGQRGEALRHLPVEVDVREDRLPPAGGGELGELVDEHLGELLDPRVVHPGEIRGEERLTASQPSTPAKWPWRIAPEADHVGQEHLGVAGGSGHGDRMGQLQSEALQVLQGLAGAVVGAIDEAQAVEMEIAQHVGVPHLPGEDVVEGVNPA